MVFPFAVERFCGAGPLLAGALVVLQAGAAAAAAPDTVQLAGSRWVADAPTKVAAGLGLFNRDADAPAVRLENLDSGKEALASLLAGESGFALAASTPVADALLSWKLDHPGADVPPLVVLASVSLSNRTHVVIANAAAGIEQPDDLAGKRIGLMMNTSGHYGWHLFARYHDLDASTLKLVDLPVASQADAVAAGHVDAAATWEPWASQLAAALGDRARIYSTRHLYSASWLLVTRPDILGRYPGLAGRVLAAYQDAIRIINLEPQRARQVHADTSGMHPADIEAMETGIIWGMGLDWAVFADLESQFRWLTERRGIPAGSAPAPREYFYAAPLRELAPRRVTLPAYFYQEDPAGDAGGAGR